MISFNDFGKHARLGNQLFQLATIISLSLDNNDDFMISNFLYQEYYNMKIRIGNSNFDKYVEEDFSYNKIPYKKDLDIFGYFQSEKYFKHNEKYINEFFQIKKRYEYYLKDKYNDLLKNSLSLHIRRGDYVNSKAYMDLTKTDYYTKAIEYVKSNKKIDNILLFSDDIEWCKRNIKISNIHYIREKDILELYLMSYCENNIIANSSFSWWASWLNQNTNKIIIAPKKWFGDVKKLSTKDLYSEKMIVL